MTEARFVRDRTRNRRCPAGHCKKADFPAFIFHGEPAFVEGEPLM